jgi:cathepsin H
MEAHYQIKYHEFRNLSEQQLVDCAGNFDNFGCDGGLPSHAFEYIYSNGGLTTEDQYPYKAVTQTCTYTDAEKSVGVKGGSVNITQGDE